MRDEPLILYLCHTFPWVTQAFTTREVAGLRDAGLRVEVIAFRRPDESLMGEEGRRLLPHTRFIPAFASPAFVLPVLMQLLRHPLKLPRWIARGAGSRSLVRTTAAGRLRGVADVLRGAWVANREGGAAHFHAEFANNACTAAMVAADLTAKTFSFKSHSSYNPQMLRRKAERAAFVAIVSRFDRDFYFSDAPPGTEFFLNRVGIAPRERRQARPRPSRILSIGTLSEKKGHRYLIEALRLLADRGRAFECLIVGSGPLEGELHGLVEAGGLGEAVRMEPYRPPDDVARLYEDSGIFVLPSIVTDEGDRDGLPAVLIEAMAAGCACVSCPVSGIPELIRHEWNGLLVPERDPRALADALERLMEAPSLAESLAARGRETVEEEFDLERNVGELAEKLREVTAWAR